MMMMMMMMQARVSTCFKNLLRNSFVKTDEANENVIPLLLIFPQFFMYFSKIQKVPRHTKYAHTYMILVVLMMVFSYEFSVCSEGKVMQMKDLSSLQRLREEWMKCEQRSGYNLMKINVMGKDERK